MDEEDLLPVTVFSGPYSEALFVKSLLESAGIESTLVMRQRYGEPYLNVRRRDAAHAWELVEDFLRKGKRTVD